MGGLIRKMPVTGLTFLIGVLAIAGTGIPGTQIGLGGFFSKDEILAVAWTRAFDWTDPARHEAHGEHHANAGHEGTRAQRHGGTKARRHEGGAESPQRQVVQGADQVPVNDTVQGGHQADRVLDQSQERERLVSTQVAGHNGPVVGVFGGPVAGAPGSDGRVVLVSDPAHGGAKSGDKGEMGDKRDEGEKHHDAHASSFAATFKSIPQLSKWMFYLALFTAYVTPFYMMRAWWLTFMGKPRDHHVYDHAHESPLMFLPLVVLALGTFFSSYMLFRPLIADAAGAATHAPMVIASDGHLHTPAIEAAHHWLKTGVGFSFLVGFIIAIVIYRGGLGLASQFKRALLPLHTLLEEKYFIDHLYHLVWVKGCMLLAQIARLFDTYVIDLIFDTLAAATERLAVFSGLVVDAHGVDGVVNGVAKSSMDFAGVVRSPQTGRIRNYVLFTAGVAAVVITIAVIRWSYVAPMSIGAAKTAAGIIGQ